MEDVCRTCGLYSRKSERCFRRFEASPGKKYHLQKAKRVENKLSLTILVCDAVYPQPRKQADTGTCEVWRDINGHDREWHQRNN